LNYRLSVVLICEELPPAFPLVLVTVGPPFVEVSEATVAEQSTPSWLGTHVPSFKPPSSEDGCISPATNFFCSVDFGKTAAVTADAAISTRPRKDIFLIDNLFIIIDLNVNVDISIAIERLY
jgi:hypothetical protein